MSLSFTEKRTLQKVVSEGLAKLKGGGVSFTEKRSLQKAIADAMAKLKGAAAPTEATPEPEPATETNPLLFDLQSGKFNSLEPMAFLGKLKEVYDAISDVEPLKAPAIAYIKANRERVGAVMESALQETFGKLWSAATVSVMESAKLTLPDKIRAWVAKNQPTKYVESVTQELIDAATGNNPNPTKWQLDTLKSIDPAFKGA